MTEYQRFKVWLATTQVQRTPSDEAWAAWRAALRSLVEMPQPDMLERLAVAKEDIG